MSKKKGFALRLDAELLEAVEKWAADEFRSTNGQLEWIIYQALLQANRLKKPKDKSNAAQPSEEEDTSGSPPSSE
ncbi:MAG: Arc family DNA-binding protein [Microscillaceae bacterium]|nr:Arc family DNA-binding protein [Microscillaceae bacterium]